MLQSAVSLCMSLKAGSEEHGLIKFPLWMCYAWRLCGPLQTLGTRDSDHYMCLSSWTGQDTANFIRYLSHTAKSTTTVPHLTLSGFRYLWQHRQGLRHCTGFVPLHVGLSRCSYRSRVESADGYSKTKAAPFSRGFSCLYGGTFGYNGSKAQHMPLMNGLRMVRTLPYCKVPLPLVGTAAIFWTLVRQQIRCNWCKGQDLALPEEISPPLPVLAAHWAR